MSSLGKKWCILQAASIDCKEWHHRATKGKSKSKKGARATHSHLAGMSLHSRHQQRSCHCIYSTLSASKTARPMFAYMSQLHACVPRVSEAAAVVLDLALCSQNSPLSTPTIRNWHRSCVLRDWNLRVRTDLHHNGPSGSQTVNTHVCK